MALLTCEAEYMASALAAQEAVWERNLLQDMYQHQLTADPTVISIDNEGAIQLAKNPNQHQ